MAANTANGLRELNADEIDGVAGAVNPWIVRIAAKLIIAAIDHIAENGLEGRSIPRAERETGNKV
jgi:hypothetical protein